MPRGAGLADLARWARSTPGRPAAAGFEYFYGFIGGENNQYDPALYDGTTPVEPPATAEEGYHLTEDLTDRAIGWVRQQKALMPDKPFFVYFAPGATHAPHHVPKEWADKYAGQFADGWDALRERDVRAAEEAGRHPAPTPSSPQRHAEIPAWDDMPAQLKPVLERQMEVYAGFLEHTDHHVGRLIDAIEDLGVLENTLVYYIIGDNGASAEGTHQRRLQRDGQLQRHGGPRDAGVHAVARSTSSARPTAYNHYSVGWAWAMNAPYQWTKQVASHWGGTRNGTIVHWPKGIKERGGLRHQFTHVIDVAPTILEAAGLPEPTHGQRRAAVADGGHQHALQLRRREGAGAARPAVLRDGRQPRHLLQGLERGHQAPDALDPDGPEAGPPSTTTSGSCTTAARTGRRRATSRRSSRTCCTSCSGCC